MKIRQMGTELFRVDGRIDVMKMIVAFHNFADIFKSYIS